MLKRDGGRVAAGERARARVSRGAEEVTCGGLRLLIGEGNRTHEGEDEEEREKTAEIGRAHV